MIDVAKANLGWKPIGENKVKLIPLFEKEEIEKAEQIAKTLDGMSIYSALTLLDKMQTAVQQLAIVR